MRPWLIGAAIASAPLTESGYAQAETAAVASPAQGVTDAEASARLADARRHFEAGAKAYARGQLRAALEHFEAAYGVAPSAELCFDIARTLERMGELERAIEMYTRYLTDAALSTAQRHAATQRVQALQSDRKRALLQTLRTPPSDDALQAEARAFFTRGVRLFRRGQLEAARSAFGAALQFAQAPELHFNLALIAERLHHTDDAIAHYRAYLSAANSPPDRADVEQHIVALRASH